jgi:hypothetical protein
MPLAGRRLYLALVTKTAADHHHDPQDRDGEDVAGGVTVWCVV